MVSEDGTSERRRRAVSGLLRACEKRPRSSRWTRRHCGRAEQLLNERPSAKSPARAGALVMSELKKLIGRLGAVSVGVSRLPEWTTSPEIRSEGPQGVILLATAKRARLGAAAKPPTAATTQFRAASRATVPRQPALIIAGIVLRSQFGGMVGGRSHIQLFSGIHHRSRPDRALRSTRHDAVALAFVLVRTSQVVMEKPRGLPFGSFRAKLVLAL